MLLRDSLFSEDGPIFTSGQDPGRALSIEHIGSTSVPGLAAKPVIDINLAVRDSANEASYVP